MCEILLPSRPTLVSYPDSLVNITAGKVDHGNAKAHYDLGMWLLGKGKLAEAKRLFRKAVRLAPDDGRAHFILGNVLLRQRRFQEAEEEWREVIRLDPDSGFGRNYKEWG